MWRHRRPLSCCCRLPVRVPETLDCKLHVFKDECLLSGPRNAGMRNGWATRYASGLFHVLLEARE